MGKWVLLSRKSTRNSKIDVATAESKRKWLKMAVFSQKWLIAYEDGISTSGNIDFRNPRAFSAQKRPLACTLPTNRADLQQAFHQCSLLLCSQRCTIKVHMRGGSTHTSHALSAKCHSVDMESDYVSRQLSRVWIRFYACKLIRLSLRSKIQCVLTIRNCRISFEIGSARSATKSPFRFVPSVCYYRAKPLLNEVITDSRSPVRRVQHYHCALS